MFSIRSAYELASGTRSGEAWSGWWWIWRLKKQQVRVFVWLMGTLRFLRIMKDGDVTWFRTQIVGDAMKSMKIHYVLWETVVPLTKFGFGFCHPICKASSSMEILEVGCWGTWRRREAMAYVWTGLRQWRLRDGYYGSGDALKSLRMNVCQLRIKSDWFIAIRRRWTERWIAS